MLQEGLTQPVGDHLLLHQLQAWLNPCLSPAQHVMRAAPAAARAPHQHPPRPRSPPDQCRLHPPPGRAPPHPTQGTPRQGRQRPFRRGVAVCVSDFLRTRRDYDRWCGFAHADQRRRLHVAWGLEAIPEHEARAGLLGAQAGQRPHLVHSACTQHHSSTAQTHTLQAMCAGPAPHLPATALGVPLGGGTLALLLAVDRLQRPEHQVVQILHLLGVHTRGSLAAARCRGGGAGARLR